MSNNKLHVVPHEDGWAIKQEGSDRVTSTHDTQKEAIEASKKLTEEGGNVVIHRADGTIRETINGTTAAANGNGNRTTSKESTMRASDVMSVGSRVSWGAVFAGAVVGLTIYVTLCFLALAIGVTTIDHLSTKVFTIGTAVVGIFSVLASLFVGGIVTSQCTVGEDKSEALIYGALLWGVFVLLLIGFGSVAGIGFGTVLQSPSTSSYQAISQEAMRNDVGLDDEEMKKYNEAVQKASTIVERVKPETRAWLGFVGVLLSIFAAVGGAVTGAGPELVLKRIRERRKLVVQS